MPTLAALTTALAFPDAPTHLLAGGPYRVRLGEPNQIGAVASAETVDDAIGRLAATPRWAPSEPETDRLRAIHTALGAATRELRFGATPSVHVATEGRWSRTKIWEILATKLTDGVRRAYEDVLVNAPIDEVLRVGSEVDLRTDNLAFTIRFARTATVAEADRIIGELDGLASDLGVLAGSRQWLGNVWRALSRMGPRTLGIELTMTPLSLRQELTIVVPDAPVPAVRAVRTSLSRGAEDPVLDALLTLLPPPEDRVAALVLKVAAQGAPTASVELR